MRISPSIILVLLTLLAVFCSKETFVPVDGNVDQEDIPVLSLDTGKTSIFDNDTIHFDSGSVSLLGNSNKSEFMVKIDTGSWSEWEKAKTYKFTSFVDGRHVVYLRTKFSDADSTIEDSIVFFVKVSGYRPEFKQTGDTAVTADAGTDIQLISEADGADSLYFQWYKDSSVIRYATDKSLSLDELTAKDAGNYRCVVTNRYGIDTGRVFTLKVLLSSGSITGTLTNNSLGCKGVTVQLLPDSTDTVTDSTGAFSFSGLSEGTYSLHITSSLYVDTTIGDITVGDTGSIAKGNIRLSKRSANELPRNLTYDGNGNNGGSAPRDTNSYRAEDKAVVAGNSDSLTKTDKYFDGWNTKKDGSGTTFHQGDTLVFDTVNVTLYALWTDVPYYTVSYHGSGNNGGSVPKDETKYRSGMTVIVRSNGGSLTKNGYTFAGWKDTENGDGTSYMPGDTFVIGSASVNLYAKWSINRYTVHYSGNGNQSGTAPADSAYTFGDTATIRSHGTLAKNGYTFVAWSTSADGNGTTVLEGKKLAVGSSDITLYAQWKVNEYKVTYSGNGHTGGSAPDTVTVKYGDSVHVSGKGNLSKTGHTFTGWSTAANGLGTIYPADTVFAIGQESIHLFARWEINRYQVYFATQGGNVIHDTTVNYNDTVPKPATPVRTGYMFAGWFKEASCVTSWNFSNDKITARDTLFVKWNNPRGMIVIRAKDSTFQIGSTLYDEQPAHNVKFTENFWMDTTEVTQAQYAEYLALAYGSNYSSPDWTSNIGLGDNYPAYLANWYDAALYCNARTKATGSNDTFYVYTSRIGRVGDSCILVNPSYNWNSNGFRLPTEAEWEYACRAGASTAFYWGKSWMNYPANDADSNEIDSYAIWWRNSEHKGSGHAGYGTSQVGHKVKNAYTLYDMSGNLAEWCNDWYGNYSGTPQIQTDPRGASNGNARVFRGGSWASSERYLRSASRGNAAPNSTSVEVGFRTCLPIPSNLPMP